MQLALDARLDAVDLLVHALDLHKLGVRTLLDDPSLIQDQDQVGVDQALDAVRDHKAGAVLHQVFERCANHRFGLGIYR